MPAYTTGHASYLTPCFQLDLFSWNNVNKEIEHIMLCDGHGYIAPLRGGRGGCGRVGEIGDSCITPNASPVESFS